MEVFKTAASEAYEGSFAYRFMEQLRNHAQHHSAPLHGAWFHSRRIEVDGELTSQRRFSTSGRIIITEIKKNDRLKKVLSELNSEQDELDVGALTREYIELLGRVQKTLRDGLNEHREVWVRHIEGAVERYAAQNDGDVLNLSVAEFSADGDKLETHTHITAELIDYIRELEVKNGSLTNLRHRFVSNELNSPQ